MTRRAAPTVSIVIPVWVEPQIEPRLARLRALSPRELIVVHAGDAATAERLRAFCAEHPDDRVLHLVRAPRGRATQMNAGADAATGDVLMFVHADTLPPPDAVDLVQAAIASGAVWGRFDVRLSGAHPAFRVIERFMNARSALTGVATGDQVIFVRRDAFRLLGGFAPIALMEDIELSRRLKWIAPPARLRTPVVASSRRWEARGIARTVVRMWCLRALYTLGVSPPRLARWYK